MVLMAAKNKYFFITVKGSKVKIKKKNEIGKNSEFLTVKKLGNLCGCSFSLVNTRDLHFLHAANKNNIHLR